MKKFQSYRLDLQTTRQLKSGLVQEDRLLLSTEKLQPFQEEIRVWWQKWREFLKKKFSPEAIWIELLTKNGGTFKITEQSSSGSEEYEITRRFPIIGQEQILGWLYVAGNFSKQPLEEELTGLLPLLGYGLFQEIKRFNVQNNYQALSDQHNDIFENLARILGLRDYETEAHTMRVSQLTMLLVEYLHLPSEQWGAIQRGALLHDIGKLGIPDEILLKPGSLTVFERRMMEMHVMYGYNILSSITNARQTLDIALYHHERWDGSGYPTHLQGTQIPLVARLFAVVDVYDALTSDRPYRAAWSPDRVLSYLIENVDKQFDAEMVTAFLEVSRLHLKT